jgi:hypothetical protein
MRLKPWIPIPALPKANQTRKHLQCTIRSEAMPCDRALTTWWGNSGSSKPVRKKSLKVENYPSEVASVLQQKSYLSYCLIKGNLLCITIPDLVPGDKNKSQDWILNGNSVLLKKGDWWRIRPRHLQIGIVSLLHFLFEFLLFHLPIVLPRLGIPGLCWRRVEKVDIFVSLWLWRKWFRFVPI